jgi:hypothetical protein
MTQRSGPPFDVPQSLFIRRSQSNMRYYRLVPAFKKWHKRACRTVAEISAAAFFVRAQARRSFKLHPPQRPSLLSSCYIVVLQQKLDSPSRALIQGLTLRRVWARLAHRSKRSGVIVVAARRRLAIATCRKVVSDWFRHTAYCVRARRLIARAQLKR